MFRRLVLCAVASLMLAVTVSAQGQVINVKVNGDGDQPTKDVAQLVRGKIGSTLRYSLTESINSADIVMNVMCVLVGSAREAALGTTANVACSAPANYFSSKAYNLGNILLGSIVVGDREYVAQTMFDVFVQETSAERLGKIDKYLVDRTNAVYLDGYNAGQISGRKSCTDKAAAAPKN